MDDGGYANRKYVGGMKPVKLAIHSRGGWVMKEVILLFITLVVVYHLGDIYLCSAIFRLEIFTKVLPICRIKIILGASVFPLYIFFQVSIMTTIFQTILQ